MSSLTNPSLSPTAKRLAAGHERELADLVLEALFLRRAFGETDAGDLRLAIGAARENGDLLGLRHAEHALDGLNSFVAGHVGKPRRPDDIAGSIDPFDVRLVVVIRRQPAFRIGFELHTLREQRADADRHERDGSFDGFRCLAGNGQLHALVGRFGFLHLRAREDLHALLGQGLLQGDADFRVFDRENVRQHFDHRDLGAEGVEEIGELDADRARADDDDVLRLFWQHHRLLAADDARSVEGETGHLAADNARGDQNIRRL